MKNRFAEEILAQASKLPEFSRYFDELYSRSSQVVIFGSYSIQAQTSESDIDILFVTDCKSVKTQFLDFICIKPQRLVLKSWLGTELANHVAQYGIWIKGDNQWAKNTFISQNSVDRKKIIILNRLSHLFLKKDRISKTLMIKLFIDVALDSYRLVQLMEGLAIPPNVVLVRRFLNEKLDIVKEICKSRYLGRVGRAYLDELFDEDISQILDDELNASFPGINQAT